MHLPRSLVLLILLPFTAFSVWVLSQVGYLGLFTANLHRPACRCWPIW